MLNAFKSDIGFLLLKNINDGCKNNYKLYIYVKINKFILFDDCLFESHSNFKEILLITNKLNIN
jgi:hypothetical protein